MNKQIIIHTDGGSRGNPGPGGAGFTLEDDKGIQLIARGIYLGRTTNNIAEYTGIKEALKAVPGSPLIRRRYISPTIGALRENELQRQQGRKKIPGAQRIFARE